MTRKRLGWSLSILALGTALVAFGVGSLQADDFEPRADWQPGQEVAVPIHLQDGEEYTMPLPKLLKAGAQIFNAVWTPQEGGGRPLTDGTGNPLVDPSRPLVFPDGHNRLSGPTPTPAPAATTRRARAAAATSSPTSSCSATGSTS